MTREANECNKRELLIQEHVALCKFDVCGLATRELTSQLTVLQCENSGI